jgi:ring-1,2-phenylacetyl-CoA epoxidase subunit PaaC
MVKAIDELWMYAGEMFEMPDYESALATTGEGVDVSRLKAAWLANVSEVFTDATLTVPEKSFIQTGGKSGKHTEYLGFILTDLQYLQRTYPGSKW